MAIKKLCSKCNRVIDINKIRCDICEARYKQHKAKSNRSYDMGRDKKVVEFYKSKSWLMLRELVKQRDLGLCKCCYQNNKIIPADLIHHIEEVKENWDKRLDIDNCISLCNACHNKIHSKYSKDKLKEQKRLRELNNEP